MHDSIKEILTHSSQLKATIASNPKLIELIEKAAAALIKCVDSGGTIYTCGNGGSACDAMHFVEELVARYKRERPGIKAMHFMEPGIVTCWSNDYTYDAVFERQVRTFCGKNDALVAFSTSGNSENVIRAIRVAKELGTFTIALLGKGGGKTAPLCDISIVAPSNETERIQEAHVTILHIFCEMIETKAKVGE